MPALQQLPPALPRSELWRRQQGVTKARHGELQRLAGDPPPRCPRLTADSVADCCDSAAACAVSTGAFKPLR